MSGFQEQIAVLDGLDFDDGRIGQQRARVDEYGRQVMPGVLVRRNVIDASEGANYSGGSSYAPGLPLLPSSIGLAELMNIPSVLPTRRHVIDYSGGANYSGGAAYAPGLPLLPSSAGLAMAVDDPTIAGGYGRAGLGMSVDDPTIAGGYGRAGLGGMAVIDADLAGVFNGFEAARYNAADGRIGQQRAQVDEYGQQIMPGVLVRRGVIDASEGANYSGGSSYAPGLPLLPSTVGLAELSMVDPFDGLGDLEFFKRLTRSVRNKFKRIAGRTRLTGLMKFANKLKSKLNRVSPMHRLGIQSRLNRVGRSLMKVRALRRAVIQNPIQSAYGPQASAIVNGVRVTASRPWSPSAMASARATIQARATSRLAPRRRVVRAARRRSKWG